MRWTYRIALAGLLGLVVLSGCGRRSEARALAPYASATLTPGVGLGNILLDRTTLGWVVGNIGPGMVWAVSGDEAAIELGYLGRQVAFLFVVRRTASGRPARPRGAWTSGAT